MNYDQWKTTPPPCEDVEDPPSINIPDWGKWGELQKLSEERDLTPKETKEYKMYMNDYINLTTE